LAAWPHRPLTCLDSLRPLTSGFSRFNVVKWPRRRPRRSSTRGRPHAATFAQYACSSLRSELLCETLVKKTMATGTPVQLRFRQTGTPSACPRLYRYYRNHPKHDSLSSGGGLTRHRRRSWRLGCRSAFACPSWRWHSDRHSRRHLSRGQSCCRCYGQRHARARAWRESRAVRHHLCKIPRSGPSH
jgi:hypothetical protein